VVYYQRHPSNDSAEPLKERLRLDDLSLPSLPSAITDKSTPTFSSPSHGWRRLIRLEDEKSTTPKKPIAVIHVGPHKTGTTSLQHFLQENHQVILDDGFHQPWTLKPPPHGGAGEFDIASCFLTGEIKANKAKGHKTLCPGEVGLNILKDLGKQGKNVLMSAELFSLITDMASFAEVMEPWDVKIVYFHRWYHDWLLSNFNQASNARLKHDILAKFDSFMAAHGSGKAQYNSLVRNFNKFHGQNFTMPDESYRSLYRYKEHFDVIALDYEDKSTTLVEKFFCDGLKGLTSRTCDEYLRQKANTEVYRTNGRKVMSYKNIAYGANMLALTSYRSLSHYEEVVVKIQHHQEKTLGRSPFDFPMSCVDDELLKDLIEVTIDHRRNILPDIPFTEDAEKQIREEYWTKMKDEKMSCDTDVAAVLALPEWSEFFDNLNKDSYEANE